MNIPNAGFELINKWEDFGRLASSTLPKLLNAAKYDVMPSPDTMDSDSRCREHSHAAQRR